MTEYELLLHITRGDEVATGFVSDLARLSQIFDDWVDGDPVTGEQQREAMWLAMVSIPSNPFYRGHFAELQPMLRAGLLDWFCANELEAAGKELETAFVLRSTLYRVTYHVALIKGGLDWAMEVHPLLHAQIYEEPLTDYQQEHTDVLQRRETTHE
ncbi:MAG: hypothetical protein ACPGVG_00475 [Mycobacterium sp.]